MRNERDNLGAGLSLSYPWYIKELEYRGARGILWIKLAYTRGHNFLGNDGEYHRVRDTVRRIWHHWSPQYGRCHVQAQVPRLLREDGSVHIATVPWARLGCGLTLAFERHCLQLVQGGNTVERTARQMGMYSQQLWGVVNHWVPRLHAHTVEGNLTHLGIHSIPLGKKGGMLTLTINTMTGQLLHVTLREGGDAIGDLARYLEGKYRDLEAITFVCTDLSHGHINGCLRHFRGASVVHAPFHILDRVEDTLEAVCHKARTDHTLKTRLADTKELVPLLERVKDMPDTETARGYLAYCCDRIRDSGIPPLQGLADLLGECSQGVVGFKESDMDQHQLKRVWQRIALMVNAGRGYRNVQNLTNLLLLRLGGVTLDSMGAVLKDGMGRVP